VSRALGRQLGYGARRVRELLERRAVLVTGKGGVGKTTFAASLAHLAARTGKRVLVAELSYEPQATSPLAGALAIPRLGEDPVQVAPNLRAVLLTPTAGHARFLRATLPLGRLADAALKTAAVRRFLLAAPALAEMGILYRLLDLAKARRRDGSPEHELIVVDLPATGHALGLTQVPATILEIVRAGPIASAVREGLSLLRDPVATTCVVVTLPETLPVSEAAELIQGLARQQVPFAGVVLNRVPADPFEPPERAAIDALVLGKSLLGARTLPRIDRARAAAARLTELGYPVASVGEVADAGVLAPLLAQRLGEFH